MSRLTSPGYRGSVSTEEIQTDLRLFDAHLERLIENIDRILAHPEWSRCHPCCSIVSAAYVGGGPVTLGELLYLYRQGDWIKECPRCGSDAYVYFAGGSPMTGMGSWQALCRNRNAHPDLEDRDFRSRKGTFGEFFGPWWRLRQGKSPRDADTESPRATRRRNTSRMRFERVVREMTE